MLFHSWLFAFFLGAVLLAYWPVRNNRWRNIWLLLVSYVFYGWWHPAYPVIMGYVTLVDFRMTARMARSPHKKSWLIVSIVNQLLMLAIFKYSFFLVESLNTALIAANSPWVVKLPGFLLPVGLSFFILKSMAYVIDCYRGKVNQQRDFIQYAVFVGFFPILPAGPIERAGHLLPQFKQDKHFTAGDLAEGLSLFIKGIFKKVALADYFALYVDKVYGNPDAFAGPALLLATMAFGWQIYFDFSGYTDMARGIARLLGFEIMENFNRPYLAKGLREFWHRWHISLSTWFRDYLYLPLGGSRAGSMVTVRNLMLVMLVSGLWHGAGWTFVLWGAYHGILLCLLRGLENSRWYRDRIPSLVKIVWTFILVTCGWILFRADNWQQMSQIAAGISSFSWQDTRMPVFMIWLMMAAWGYELLSESRLRHILEHPLVRIGFMTGMILYLFLCGGITERTFIYYRF